MTFNRLGWCIAEYCRCAWTANAEAERNAFAAPLVRQAQNVIALRETIFSRKVWLVRCFDGSNKAVS